MGDNPALPLSLLLLLSRYFQSLLTSQFGNRPFCAALAPRSIQCHPQASYQELQRLVGFTYDVYSIPHGSSIRNFKTTHLHCTTQRPRRGHHHPELTNFFHYNHFHLAKFIPSIHKLLSNRNYHLCLVIHSTPPAEL